MGNEVATEATRVWPAYMVRGRRRYPRAWQPWTEEEEKVLLQMHVRQCSLQEISAALGRGEDGVRLRLERLKSLRLRQSAVQEEKPVKKRLLRFLPVPLMDYIPQDVSLTPDPRWLNETAQVWGVDGSVLDKALHNLDQTHWLVLVLRYGLAGRCAFTIEAIAKLLGKKQDLVAQLQVEAEERVREALAFYGSAPISVTLQETLSRAYSIPVGNETSCAKQKV